MKISRYTKLALAAAFGLAFAAVTAHAQLAVNLHERALFGPFVGGTNNGVTNNGGTDTTDVITTGTPLATPFNITFTPFTGPSTVTLGTGTLNTSSFTFNSPITPLSYFTSLSASISYDFDNNGTVDLVQAYTINLSPFTSPNGFTGVAYQIIPTNFFGSVTINGNAYAYTSAVANSTGTLLDGSTTVALLQFQFLATPVPEPSTYALAGVAVLGAVTYFRRRRSVSSSTLAA